MIKIVYCLRRKPSLTYDEFLTYWQGVHGEIVVREAKTLRLAKYVQNVRKNDRFSGLVEDRKNLQDPYDGVAELFWETEEEFRHAFEDVDAKRVQKKLIEDQENFIDLSRSCRWIVTENKAI